MRNPWRFAFDRANGNLWIGDVGQDAWEEVDFRPVTQLAVLANYGWSVYEGRARFKSETLDSHGVLVKPVYVYPHSAGACSIFWTTSSLAWQEKSSGAVASSAERGPDRIPRKRAVSLLA